MFKFLSITKKQTSVIITLLILIFFGASYFFIYVPNNERTVQERRFRCLQNIDININSKIDNSVLLASSVLQTNSTDKIALQINSVNKFYANYFTLLPLTGKKTKGKFGRIPGILKDSLVEVQINIDADSRQLTVVENKPVAITAKSRKIQDTLKVGIRFRMDQFIKPLLPSDVFDNYIVFYNGSKIYESFPSGLSYKVSDSLLDVKNGITGPGVRSLHIDGTDYKMFSQPVNIGAGEKWIVAGLVTSKNYQKEKNQLPLWLILMLLTCSLGIIVCLPWIKLYHMGSKDKLTVRDGVATVLIAMILMSLLFFVSFKYNINFGLVKDPPPPDSKDILANKITNAFEKELDSAYRLMDTCDKIYTREKTPDKLNLGRDSGHDLLLKKLKKNIAVHQVFWIDTAGRELYNWVSDAGIPKGSDASARDYFQHAKNYKSNRQGPNTFYLDQIISKATGVFTSVISKRPAGRDTIMAMGFSVKSLNNVIMPDGYQFAIIDENGKVLYHYHPGLNLGVNLKAEFADSSKLISSLEAKSDTNFDVEYFGKRYNVKIRPFADLPYHLVIFEDLEYNDTRDMQAYAFTLSMLMCLLVFLIIEFVVIFFASSKRSFFKKQLFETSWVGPKISSHGEYNLAIIANLIIIGMMSLFFKYTFSQNLPVFKSSFLEYVYIILFSIVLTSLVLNALFAAKYHRENCYKFRYKKNAIFFLCLFIFVIDVSAYETLTPIHFGYLMAYEVLSTGICAAAMIWIPKLLTKMRDYKQSLYFIKKWSFTHSFAMMATTRLIISSGIPVAFFFVYSYDYEQNLDTRFKQYHFAKDVIQRIDPSTITDARLDSLNNQYLFTSAIYEDGVSIKTLSLQDSRDTLARLKRKYRYSNEDYKTANILSLFRFRVNNVETKNNNMNLPVVDSVAFFNKLTREKGNDAPAETYYKLNTNRYLLLDSANTNYKNPNLLLLTIIIFLFFFVLHNIIRKLFALDLPSEDGWRDMNENLLKNNDLNKLLLVVGSPGSGKLTRLTKTIQTTNLLGNNGERLIYDEKNPENNNVFIADMILISTGNEEDYTPPKDQGVKPGGVKDADGDLKKDEGLDARWKECRCNALSDKNALVIINHLEYNIKDTHTNNRKLELLEELMHKGKSKIMIISTVHPVSFLDSHNQQIKKSNKELSKQGSDDKLKPEPENELERWQVLFGHFRIIIEPLEKGAEAGDNVSSMEEIIMSEIKYSHFLNKMKAIMPKNFEQETENVGPLSDSLIFKLQLTSQYFYTYIWQSLTMEEKFLLYDLAEDGLVNSYDDYNLSLLLSKRLIMRVDGTLVLFNKGFRNFILTAIGQTEADRIKDQVKSNGNWDSLKLPLGITILAILVFLFTSQEEAYSRIITYITAFSAGIPAVLKIFSMFGGGAKKSE